MLTESNIAGRAAITRKELTKLAPDLLRKFPIENYVHEIKASKKWQRYYYLSPELKKIFKEVRSGYGLHVMANYHKLALTILMQDSLARLKKENITQTIKEFYLDWFRRILKDLATQPDAYYNAEDFPFIQDLAVCSLRAIPVGGAWLIEISRAKELAGELGSKENKKDISFRYTRIMIAKLNLGRLIRPILYKLGIYKLYYQVHTYPRYLLRFTPEEMENSYLEIAELLRRNKRIKGLFRQSWFLDPQLENISPELTYLRKVPEQNGAKVFPSATFQNAINNALAFSPKRRKLYMRGKYSPTCFAYIWPRKELLKWAENKEDFPFT